MPIKDGGVDVAVLSQALHHAADPARAVAEAARVVAPGGKVLVLDLRAHGEGWVRDRLGDRWQGFEDGALARLLKDAGLKDVRVGVGARKSGNPFTVLVASGRRNRTGRGARASRPRRLNDIDTRTLNDLLARRILVIDGAMGTMIQRLQARTRPTIRGERFGDHPRN